jgi:mannose-1-phosphate guanylyltransferase/mannose-6-phosphate isomerase
MPRPQASPLAVIPVLLAGGSGTRLWPLSREQYPKQFLSFLGQRSLFQNTALRVGGIEAAVSPIVVGSQAHRFLIAEQLREADVEATSILLEPHGRNTVTAAAVAAHFVAAQFGEDALIFLAAADHAIEDQHAFARAVECAAKAAADDYIVTFGIKPTRAETGYGYLKAGAPLGEDGACRVEAFIEKPDADNARTFVEAGDHYWNGGMFLFRCGRFLDELRRLEPETHAHALESLLKARYDNGFVHLDETSFAGCRSQSIDYAIMEKTDRVALVPLDAGWDDVGSWSFLERMPASDERGNRTRGDVMAIDASGNLAHSSGRLVALLGVEDHIVIETDDAVLIAPKNRAQDVGKAVQALRRDKRTEAESHRRVYRPWGFYEIIALGERFQVKRISVKPGHKLSLQMHYHRAEHWVVVKGTARVSCADKTFILTENQSTYIPVGNTHRLENAGKLPLELIEVQSGGYLGEDDIVRFSDAYGRVEAAPQQQQQQQQQPQPQQQQRESEGIIAAATTG